MKLIHILQIVGGVLLTVAVVATVSLFLPSKQIDSGTSRQQLERSLERKKFLKESQTVDVPASTPSITNSMNTASRDLRKLESVQRELLELEGMRKRNEIPALRYSKMRMKLFERFDAQLMHMFDN